MKSWRKISSSYVKSTVLAGVRKTVEEPYETFVVRIEKAIEHMMPVSVGFDFLIKILAFENANTMVSSSSNLFVGLESLRIMKKSALIPLPVL